MLLQRLGMAGEGGELAFGGAGDAALEAIVLHDDRVHGLLRRLREQMLEGLGVADQPGELVLRRGGDQMLEPLALRGDGFDRILGSLGELLLEGVGVAGEGGQSLLRRQSDGLLDAFDILAKGRFDAAGMGVQPVDGRAGERFELALQAVGLLADRGQRVLRSLVDGVAQIDRVAGDGLDRIARDARELLVEGLGVACEGDERFIRGLAEAFDAGRPPGWRPLPRFWR